MNELDILNLFYDEMVARGETREAVFLSIDEEMVGFLSAKIKEPVSLEYAQKVTDICIANEWLERTTADPAYNYLSLTAAGLQVVLAAQYR
ncbi:hypothetical protein BN59_02821 [Legionella massiliensis]|uniref:Uncharacterized protein n=1 Tax=Legionella massiliensis TaxID=1034943 RepID=A0A078L051_9GAMM|nr:hypothetical protein [Legionella massiliensis]CDZ78511.1 hypothetical protein BN59_02821 [Legionella massiliensis]CEE14249.1 hypothetical protein BN1094_02821 [Legionella massiliensis]